MIEHVASVFCAYFLDGVCVPVDVCLRETNDVGQHGFHLVDAHLIFETFVVDAEPIGVL